MPELVVNGGSTLVDEAMPMRVTGLHPYQRAAVKARMADAEGHIFSAQCEFEAGADGLIDVCSYPCLAGSYSGIDPCGLWWSMRSREGAGFTPSLAALRAVIEVRVDGHTVASTTVSRQTIAAGVHAQRVADGAVVGVLFIPARQPAPGVVVLGGSGGGVHWSSTTAALLASRGFTTLAYAYFGATGRPRTLNEIPLEDVGDALRWLLRRPEVRRGRVGLVGRSRGGELALQAAALHQEAGPVVGFASSGVRWTGYDPASSRPRSAWSWRGRELPYLVPDPATLDRAWHTAPVALRAAFAHALHHAVSVEEATIPVEAVRAPLLLVSGGDDQMWPAADMSRIALARRRGLSWADGDEHLVFSAAGHAVGQPPGLPLHDVVSRHPIDGETYLLGGTQEGNAASGAVAWPRMLDFLAAHLHDSEACDSGTSDNRTSDRGGHGC